MKKIKFGITEAGDPSQNYSWENNCDKMDVFILITKNITDRKFLKQTLKHKHKLIIHASITTLGNSYIEPTIDKWEDSIDILNKFSTIFPIEQLVLRIDPVIPTHKVLGKVEQLLSKSLIKRVRFSLIDNYKHLNSRGLKLPWTSFHPPFELVNNTIELFKSFENKGYSIECCAENFPSIIPHYWTTGCISFTDYDILKIPYDPKDKFNFQTSKQRKSCNCLTSKQELIDLKINPIRCTNNCLYCYWR